MQATFLRGAPIAVKPMVPPQATVPTAVLRWLGRLAREGDDQQRSQNKKISYFGPVAYEVVIDPGELDDFRIVAVEPRYETLDRAVEVEYQTAGVAVADWTGR